MPPYGYPAPPAHHGYPPAPPGRENYDALSRTIYVSGIDQMLTEDQLRQFFSCCGAVTAVRLCGDSSRTARFAFVEFDTREAAVAAIGLSSTTLGNHQIRVSPSKTAIQKRPAPLPSSPEVLERVSRTIHVGNLDISVHYVVRSLAASERSHLLCYRCRPPGDRARPARVLFELRRYQEPGARRRLGP